VNRIVIHYSEIALKGKNRSQFEDALLRHVRAALGPLALDVRKQQGRLMCKPADHADPQQIREVLARIPGIVNFSLGHSVPKDVDALGARAVRLLAESSFTSFGVKTKRTDKAFPMTSEEISRAVGAAILRGLDGKQVNLTDPDLWLYIELTGREAVLFTAKHAGPGGLPVGSCGSVMVSLSGGIDSPVAAYMLMKRGCRAIFAHIRNETQFTGGVTDKIEQLVATLTRYQLHSTLNMVPFGELQRRIIAFVPADYRMIIYRRAMMRILNRLAVREGAQAIVTGDAVGQVASQTLGNLHCIHAASPLPVLSPLVGMNKDETIAIARQIGTYQHSIEPYPDCCSFMIAPHPETRGVVEMARTVDHRGGVGSGAAVDKGADLRLLQRFLVLDAHLGLDGSGSAVGRCQRRLDVLHRLAALDREDHAPAVSDRLDVDRWVARSEVVAQLVDGDVIGEEVRRSRRRVDVDGVVGLGEIDRQLGGALLRLEVEAGGDLGAAWP
jgi:thiamine biosynthesis protein ThiI